MRLSYVRELDDYPTERRRIWILAMVVLAVLIGSYEGQMAPVVPLLLVDLDMDLATYGSISAAATVAGAVAAGIGGRLTDHLGRVRLLVPLMLLTALCCLAMTLVHSPRGLLVGRVVLAFVESMAVVSTAPLIRDFSPRRGRAQAFGFWTWGPVGGSLLASGIAAWTLPVFADSWRSQFVIMGVVSLVASAVIAATIADLSPRLRASVQVSGSTGPAPARSGPARGRDLAGSRRLRAHAVGISVWLVLYLSLATYGPTMLVDSLGITPARASAIMTAFWVCDLVVLVAVGRLSDRLQLRKPFVLGGTLAAVPLTAHLIVLLGRDTVSTGELMLTGALLGAALAVAYGPWMASFSEDAEDVDPRLQGTAWGVFGLLSRLVAVAVLLAAPQVVAATGWRTWLSVSLLGLVLFIPAVFRFGGGWSRPPAAAAARSPGPGARRAGAGR